MDRPDEDARARTAAAVVWGTACTSIVLSLTAATPPGAARVAVGVGTVLAAIAAATPFVRRASRFAMVLLTLSGAAIAMMSVTWISEGVLATKEAWSRAGGAGERGAWLFTTAVLLLAVGVLTTGRLVARDGLERGQLSPRAHRWAGILPFVSSAGFAVIAFVPVSTSVTGTKVHNMAAVAAVGSLIVGMALTPLLRRLPLALRVYSGTAAVLVIVLWTPLIVTFASVTRTTPIATMEMQLAAFVAAATWFAWIAAAWDRPRQADLDPDGRNDRDA